MIPKNIRKEHIIKAIGEIRKSGIPKGRRSRKFVLKFEGKSYPPKYVISLANKYANGAELNPSEFSGGRESNDFLRALGFQIVETPTAGKPISSEKRAKVKPPKIRHDERCRRCKETIRRLLERIYGRVEVNYKFEVGTRPEDYEGTPYYGKLKEIYEVLQNHRGFRNFVRVKTLPYCDFFVPDPGFILEFDESQHFTLSRKIALKRYPSDLELGFDRERWIRFCERIDSKDNDPRYRDEQRAWYDTLRDFLPAIIGLKPTVRLFARDFVWCSLDPEDPSDVRRFKNILMNVSQMWEVEVREEENPFLARVIIASEWRGEPEEARRLLGYICDRWPKSRRVKFLITCGGFIQFEWPESVSREDIGDNLNPNGEAVNVLVSEAERCINLILNRRLRDRLKEMTDYVTLGVDSHEAPTAKNRDTQPHIELVFLVDLRNGELYWTGKSYPTSDQQRGLVRIADLRTHFLNLDVGKVMVLGCHDLTVFNPRSKIAKGWRRRVNEEFNELARREKPIYVLHHPHTMVKVRSWLNAWSNLRKTLPSVKAYAGAGKFHDPDREPYDKYDKIEDVLKYTKLGNTIDFVVKLG
ncbi:MAG: hypothetical protein J7K49_01715 [Thaumarchaeota archaeon]|nr:hypothetical protein [Nitrososphaerota archaeon]